MSLRQADPGTFRAIADLSAPLAQKTGASILEVVEAVTGPNGNKVINFIEADQLLEACNQTISPVDLNSVRIKKDGKEITDAQEDIFPRAGSSNITRQFENWFIKLDPTNIDHIKQIS